MKERLEQYLKDQGMKVTQFARESGVSYSVIDSILNGRTDALNVGVSKAIKIAEAMGSSIEEIYGIEIKTDVKPACTPGNSDNARLLSAFDRLNSEGRAKVLAYLDDLIATNKYF